MKPARQHYDALDLLRGFAATVVCLYHVHFLFLPGARWFANGYLCVDLFFVLSGFVIAANYDHRIAGGLTLRGFLVDRLARLYPLFALTTLLGLMAISVQQVSKVEPADGARIALTLMSNLLVLPSFQQPWHARSVFPLNGATWSIFFELWGNVVFFLVWRWLDRWTLRIGIIAAALALVVVAAWSSGLDVGWGIANFWQGWARVLFSFFAGVAIFRSGIAERRRFGEWVVWLWLLPLGLLLNSSSLLPASLQAASDALAVLLVFPAAVAVIARAELSPLTLRLATLLGGASYSIYLLQTPLLVMASGLPQVLLHRKVAEFAPWAGLLFVPGLLVASWATWRWFELPAKAWVRQTLRPVVLARSTPRIID